MTIKFFPTNFVSYSKVEKHDEIKDEILPRILHYAQRHKDSFSHKWDEITKSKVITTYRTGIDKDIAAIILDKYIKYMVWDPFKEVVDFAGVRKFDDAGVTSCWWNVYNTGDYADMHTHSAGVKGNPNYSGVYFLDMDEENTLEFVSPVLSSTHPIDSTFHTMTTGGYEDPSHNIGEGMVCIFPSSLMHHVKPCAKRRVTISFNIACRYPEFDSELQVYPTDPNAGKPVPGTQGSWMN